MWWRGRDGQSGCLLLRRESRREAAPGASAQTIFAGYTYINVPTPSQEDPPRKSRTRRSEPAAGPFQRRLQEIGGITPLVFGQYGELSASFEALIDTLAIKGCDQAADRYLLDVGPGAASVQKRLLRQRVNCCVARAQAGVLLRRLKFALPGWTEAESRRGAWAQKSAQRG